MLAHGAMLALVKERGKLCSSQVLEHLHGCSRHGAFDLLLNLYVCY
jgi:hypothetical protein